MTVSLSRVLALLSQVVANEYVSFASKKDFSQERWAQTLLQTLKVSCMCQTEACADTAADRHLSASCVSLLC